MIDARIDQVARTSAEQLRAGTTGDVVSGLADLHVRQAQHRRQARMGAAASLVLAIGLGVAAGSLVRHADDAEPAPTHRPTHRPTPSPTPLPGSHAAICTSPRVTCRADGSYGFALERPVIWALPPGFGADSGGGATSLSVESYRQTSPSAGVTVLEQVNPAAPDGLRAAAGVADGPQAFVDWVSTRPFLDASPVRRTTLDGHPAWTVRVTLDRGADPGGAHCTIRRDHCHPVAFQAGPTVSGIWGAMASQYTAFHLPGAGTTVVWSWIFSGDTRHLGTLEEAVHSISWPDD